MAAQVNRPTNVAQKEADVNRKLQFYGIATAFRNGKAPSNEQIDIALNSFIASQYLANPSEKLSPEGRALVADFRDVVKQAQHLFLTKNQGNLLQDFIWQSQKIDGGNASVPGAPVDKDTARQHGNEALEGFRTLGTLIISNGQFRKLLNDASILIRDIAGDAAQKAANKVNPSQEQLSQIDKPADDNTWHDVPNMSAGNIKNQIKSTYSKQGPAGKGDLQEVVGDASQAAHPSGSRDPTDVVNTAAEDEQRGTSSGINAVSGLQAGASTLQKKAQENIPEDTKEQARLRRERTRQYFAKKMPEERREQTIYRLRKMVVEIQGHPDYAQAINTLLHLAETYVGHANTVGQSSAGTLKGAHADDSLKRAEQDLKTLIERFANNTSSDDLFAAINNIYQDAEKDPELKSWFKQVDAYIRKCLQKQGYIMEDRAADEWNELYDRGNFLLRDRYRNHTDRVVDEFKFLGDQFDQDQYNRKFAQSLQKLFNDLGNDDNGKPTFKPHLIKDLSEVIIPDIISSVRYIPIPRLEYTDDTMDAVIENLVIESDNLMPNILEIANDNYVRWGRRNVGKKNQHSIMVSVSGIQMDLKDVSFYVKKKHGFPTINDLGIADIILEKEGLTFKIKLSTADEKDRQNFFKVDKVDVNVKKLDIKLRKSKYKLLFKIAKPIMLKTLRPALQKIVEKSIKDKIHEIDTLLYQVKLEVDRAQQQVIENPEEAQNIYNRYVTAFQKKVMQGKQKTEEVKAKTTVNVAYTKHDSIFPDIHLPGGISSKATEYHDLALRGETWESPVFKLGTASVSNDIAPAPEVTRKHHNVTEGGVRGPQNVGNTSSMTDQLHNHSAQQQGYSNGGAGNGYAGGSTNSAFSNQVDQAFGHENPQAHGLNGKSNGHTTLGANNPVYTGSV